MKAILICPADHPATVELAVHVPLVLVPILGRTTLEYWIEWLAGRGVVHVTVLASDRPARLREHVGDGRRWGVQVDVVPTAHEFTPEQARARFGPACADVQVHVADHLPDQAGLPLFESYAGWFAAQREWMGRAASPSRVGLREVSPGIWVGLHAEIDARARLTAPCWIGDYARVAATATVGPGAVVDDRAIVDEGARIVESTVAPDTYVGKFVSVEHSLATGTQLINWKTNSVLQVPDALLLADLTAKSRPLQRTTWFGRFAAGVAMAAISPLALGVIALSLLRGEAPWQLRLGLRPQAPTRRAPHNTFAYYELTGVQGWLRRWPQFWAVMRGDMAWTGNRPLRPTQALTLANEFERLWLAAPVGLISLADVHNCADGISDEAVAHANYYAVHASAKLDAFILWRALLRACAVWPLRRGARKDVPVPLQNLATRQEL